MNRGFATSVALMFLLSSGTASAAASCPVAPIADNVSITAEVVGDFANRNNLSIQQTVCCLPGSWRRNFVVATQSPSAQRSTPHGARILLFPPFDPTGRRQIDRSISFRYDRNAAPITDVSDGANASVANTYSLEVMDQDQGQPRFSDIRFDRDMADAVARGGRPRPNVGQSATVHANAQQCTSCHGSRETGGTYPVFSFAPVWPNTFPRFYKASACPTPAETQEQLREKEILKQEASRSDSPYACLPGFRETINNTRIYDNRETQGYLQDTNDRGRPQRPQVRGPVQAPSIVAKGDAIAREISSPTEPNRLRLATEVFETDMVTTHNRRLAGKIKGMKGFDKYKFSIAGSLIGCFDPLKPELAKWFPKTETDKQAQNASANGSPFSEARVRPNRTEQEIQRDLHCQNGAESANFQTQCFPPGCQTAAQAARAVAATLKAQTSQEHGDAERGLLRSVAKTNLDLKRNWLVEAPGGRNEDADSWGAFRYLAVASGSGFDMNSEWSTIFSGGLNHRLVDNLGRQLIEADDELRSLMAEIRRTRKGPTASACADLQRRSLQAFGAQPGAAAPETPARARR